MSAAALRTARVSVWQALQPLFARADREDLLFYSSYRGRSFTPSELRAEMARGRFIWGPKHWQLRRRVEA